MSIAGGFTRAAATVIPRLSFPLASSLGRGLGSVAWAIDARHREVAMNNLRLAFPKLTESRRRQLARKAFQQAGRTAVEMLWSTSLDDRTLEEVAVFEGREHLDAALREGRGALITTAHFGNWELMGVTLAHIGVPMNVIARAIDDPQVEDVLQRLRTRTGARVIHKESGAVPRRPSGAACRRGGRGADRSEHSAVASVIRAVLRQNGGNHPSERPTPPAHRRTGAHAVQYPEGDGYRFLIEPLDASGISTAADDAVEQLTAAMNTHIERHIRRCPGAWLWIHDRWRIRPPAAARASNG